MVFSPETKTAKPAFFCEQLTVARCYGIMRATVANVFFSISSCIKRLPSFYFLPSNGDDGIHSSSIVSITVVAPVGWRDDLDDFFCLLMCFASMRLENASLLVV